MFAAVKGNRRGDARLQTFELRWLAFVASMLTANSLLDRADFIIGRFLERLAEIAGGRTWSATSDRQLRELFTSALEEMRARYLLTYTPHGVERPGWHALKVRLRNGRADITARPGYFVAAAAPS